MRYESIADIYSANQKFRDTFVATVSAISPDEAVILPEGEKWNLQQLIEHVSIVGINISRLCAKLLEGAKQNNVPSDGSFALSGDFGEKAAVIAVTKVEAPDRVHPTGDVSIDQSLATLAAATKAFDALRPDFESYDLSAHTFPHPFFGPLTAGEWLVMAGLHEKRHAAQIEGLLAKVRA
ncbi:MAG: DinB family protein [Pyrinomonadaceae bacterium]